MGKNIENTTTENLEHRVKLGAIASVVPKTKNIEHRVKLGAVPKKLLLLNESISIETFFPIDEHNNNYDKVEMLFLIPENIVIVVSEKCRGM